jgi:nucleoside-diphosphate-sugar epimerase
MIIKRIALVTGGTGFTGSYLIKRLVNDGWIVHVVVRASSDLSILSTVIDKIKYHRHDGSAAALIKIIAISKPDIVFHLAALVITQHTPEDIAPLLQSNLIFSTQLLEAMVVNGVSRIINTGTFWQHYENREYSPTCLYAATKQAFESILQYYIEAKTLNAITLILFDSYGPSDPRPKLFSLLNEASKSDKVLAMSPGEQKIDLVHIFDLVEAFVVASTHLLETDMVGCRRYKVSSGNLMKLKDIVSIYEMIVNIKLPIQWGGRPYRDREVMVPYLQGESLPGWSPKISLVDGIKTLFTKP